MFLHLSVSHSDHGGGVSASGSGGVYTHPLLRDEREHGIL